MKGFLFWFRRPCEDSNSSEEFPLNRSDAITCVIFRCLQQHRFKFVWIFLLNHVNFCLVFGIAKQGIRISKLNFKN